MLYTCEHLEGKLAVWKHQVQAAAIGATYSWTTAEAFEKHCVASTHVSIWKALAVLEGPSASCCHWSNIQMNHNWSFWEALCAKYTCEHLESIGCFGSTKSSVAAAIGATYSWTKTEAFEKHCVLSLYGNKMGKCFNGSTMCWMHAPAFAHE